MYRVKLTASAASTTTQTDKKAQLAGTAGRRAGSRQNRPIQAASPNRTSITGRLTRYT